MANEQNLKPFNERTESEQRAIQKKGGEASGRSRREKRDLRQALEMLLEKDFTDKNGKTISGAEAVTVKLFEKAMKGDVRAFETLRDTVGQKPVEKVMITEVDQAVIDEVERAILQDE